MEETELQRIIGEAIGQASMCWSETPKGVFDSTMAIKIRDEVVRAIEETFPPKDSLPRMKQ